MYWRLTNEPWSLFLSSQNEYSSETNTGIHVGIFAAPCIFTLQQLMSFTDHIPPSKRICLFKLSYEVAFHKQKSMWKGTEKENTPKYVLNFLKLFLSDFTMWHHFYIYPTSSRTAPFTVDSDHHWIEILTVWCISIATLSGVGLESDYLKYNWPWHLYDNQV